VFTVMKQSAIEEALWDRISENVCGDARVGDGRLNPVMMAETPDDLANYP
jgi:hypothetical protein